MSSKFLSLATMVVLVSSLAFGAIGSKPDTRDGALPKDRSAGARLILGPEHQRPPVMADEPKVSRSITKNADSPRSLQANAITWTVVDTMENAYGVLNLVKPMAYDPGTNAVVFVHRALSTASGGYGAISGELWFNMSTNNGASWVRQIALNDGISLSDRLARYPSGAIWNPTNSSNLSDAVLVFSAPNLLVGASGFGRIVYGNGGFLNAPSPFAIVDAGNLQYSASTGLWTGGGSIGVPTPPGVYWTAYTAGSTDSITLWRTGDYSAIFKSVPPDWSEPSVFALIPTDIGAYRNGRSYSFAMIIRDGEASFNPAYSMSTNGGQTWGPWVAPPDWRTVGGIGPNYRDFFRYQPPFASFNVDMVVDLNNRVHFIAMIVDSVTSERALVEIYETGTGWASKMISTDIKESTDLTYGTSAINQTGHMLHAAISPGGEAMAVAWLDAPSQGNPFPEIWMSARHVQGSWSAPANLTGTQFEAELALHAAPTLKDNGSGSYTMFLSKSFERGTTNYPPDDLLPTEIFAGTTTFTAVQLAKNIQVTTASVVPPNPVFGTSVTVSAIIENLGSEADPASVPLTYKAGSVPGSQGDGVGQVFNPTWSNHTATVTFTTTYTPPAPGVATIYVKAFYPGDQDPLNDLSSATMNVLPVNDVRPMAFNDPIDGGAKKDGQVFSPTATFRNTGVANQTTPFNVRYDIIGTAYSSTKSIATLDAGVDQLVTFDPVAGGLAAGTYVIRAVSLLGTDQVPNNDTLLGTLYVLPIISAFPYSQDFEDGGGAGFGWYTGRIYERPPGAPPATSVIDWVKGTPAKTQISGAHSGTKCYVTGLTGVYSNHTETFVGSPVFNFSSVSTPVILEFWQNMKVEPDWDGGAVEVSTDGGVSWRRIDSTLGAPPGFVTSASANWHNSNDTLGYLDYIKFSHNADSAAAYPGDPYLIYPGNSTGWFKSATLLNVAGLSDVRFRWHFSSDDLIASEGWAIDDIRIRTATSTVNVPINAAWNMISNPVVRTANTDSVRHLFPNSSFPYAFGFNPGSGYVQSHVMQNGPGFWAKFDAGEINPISGSELLGINVAVGPGWNMVGSISNVLDTAAVSTNPANLRASNWFGYSGSYVPVSQLTPGLAYWVKMSASGTLALVPGVPPSGPNGYQSPASTLEALNTLTISDASGNSQILYFGAESRAQVPVQMFELPPLPPQGVFDARFVTDDAGFMVQTHGADVGEFTIVLQAQSYPLALSWSVGPEVAYALVDAFGGEIFPLRSLTGTGAAVITQPAVNRLLLKTGESGLVPKEFALFQNYPNPFNPSTLVKYALPVGGRVLIEVYNVLGQKVKTLVSEEQAAGFHVVEWNGTGNTGQTLGSGVYWIRMSANGPAGESFAGIKKVMFLK